MNLTWNLFVCFLALFSRTVESSKENRFSIKDQKTLAVSESTLGTVVTKSLLGCSTLCSTRANCSYGIYNSKNSECMLDAAFDVAFENSTTSTVVIKCGRKVKGIHSILLSF